MAKPKNSSPDADAESTSFEGSFRRLQEMAEQLETGGLTLADATSRFEEGMKLVQHCNELLSNAELKITELKQTYSVDDAPNYADDDLEEDPDE
ncbi:MAG: exodeoxyribonuclease VII small subunit [SAR202 cluster bacterium]|nr:exodeoxyribonuclease VII small subunit [SAR202 cluster bacterium]